MLLLMHLNNVLTLSGCNGKSISTRHFGHHLPSKWSDKDLDTLVPLKILHAQLPILVATKGDETTSLCKSYSVSV